MRRAWGPNHRCSGPIRKNEYSLISLKTHLLDVWRLSKLHKTPRTRIGAMREWSSAWRKFDKIGRRGSQSPIQSVGCDRNRNCVRFCNGETGGNSRTSGLRRRHCPVSVVQKAVATPRQSRIPQRGLFQRILNGVPVPPGNSNREATRLRGGLLGPATDFGPMCGIRRVALR